jgi:putative membrane protein insertion efficiency factor
MYRIGIAAIWFYRVTFGAFFPTTCKYHPSCSQYAVDALRANGLLRGSALAAWRLLRCNPWSHGGFDPAPTRANSTPKRTVT